MKKIIISIFLCLISLTLISCEKKTNKTTLKTSPISSTTNTTNNTQSTVKPTTTLSNDELTDYYYKELVKKAKKNTAQTAFYTFNMYSSLHDSLGEVIVGLDLSESNSGKLLVNFKINKYSQLSPEVSVALSLKNLENQETEDFLFVTVSKDIFAMIKCENEALDKGDFVKSDEYAQMEDIKYAVNMTSILNLKITDYIDLNIGAAGSILSTTIRGLLSTVLLNSNRSIGTAVTNLIRTLSLIGIMDSNGKIDIDRTAEIVKTVMYAVKQKEYEGQPKKILTLRSEIDQMVNPIVNDLKERISTIEVVDNERKTEFGYEFEITNINVLVEFFKVNIDLDAKVSAKLIFTQTKATGENNITSFVLSAGAINLVNIDITSSLNTEIVFDLDINNYTIVDFSQIKALLDTFKQE